MTSPKFIIVILLFIGLSIAYSLKADEIELFIGGKKYDSLEDYKRQRVDIPLAPLDKNFNAEIEVDSDQEVATEKKEPPIPQPSLKEEKPKEEWDLDPSTINPSHKVYTDFLPAPGYRYPKDPKNLDLQIQPDYITDIQNSFTDNQNRQSDDQQLNSP